MPCYDGMPEPTELEKRIGDSLRIFKYALDACGRPYPDLVTRASQAYGYVNDRRIEPLFCEFMSNLRDNEPGVYDAVLTIGGFPGEEIRTWWRIHQAKDAVIKGDTSNFPETVDQLRVAALRKMDRVDAALLGLLDQWDTAHNFTPELNKPSEV